MSTWKRINARLCRGSQRAALLAVLALSIVGGLAASLLAARIASQTELGSIALGSRLLGSSNALVAEREVLLPRPPPKAETRLVKSSLQLWRCREEAAGLNATNAQLERRLAAQQAALRQEIVDNAKAVRGLALSKHAAEASAVELVAKHSRDAVHECSVERTRLQETVANLHTEVNRLRRKLRAGGDVDIGRDRGGAARHVASIAQQVSLESERSAARASSAALNLAAAAAAAAAAASATAAGGDDHSASVWFDPTAE